MGSSLTGSAPKASFSTQPTIMPSQDQLLNDLVGILETGDPVKGVQSYGGSYAAPLNSLQNASLTGLETAATAAGTPPTGSISTAQQSGGIDEMFNALSKALSYTPPKIDSTEAFSKGVVAPLTENFTQNILPAISGQYAGSAGGAYSSGRQQASQQAGQSLDQTLAAQGSTMALGAEQANQNAALQANQQVIGALGLAPGVIGTPTQLAGAQQGITSQNIQQLLATLQGGSVPYNVAQTQIAGQYGEFQRQQNEEQQIIADFIAAMGQPTVQTLGVGTGGSSGILGPLFGALGTAGGAWLKSDERLKRDFEYVADVEGFPLYKFRYKDDHTPRIGFMAQDVERRLPSAVATDSRGYKSVNYAAVLGDILDKAT